MNVSALKRLVLVLAVFCAVLIVGSGFLFWHHGCLLVQSSFADEQTAIFDEMRTQALKSSAPRDIAGSLQYAAFYYPSGTKQQIGSKLDRVVERHRTAAVRDIIAHLRYVSGQDLGDKPEPWIQRYLQK